MADVLEVEVRGLQQLISKVQGISNAPDVNRAIFDAVGARFLDIQRKRFLAQTDPDGKPWPVSRAALSRKARGVGGGTLYDTGTLFNSIQFGVLNKTTAEIGTDVPYSRKHQFGEDGLPVRQFLGFAADDAQIAAQIAVAVVEGLFEDG